MNQENKRKNDSQDPSAPANSKASKLAFKPTAADALKKKHKKTRAINYTLCVPSTAIAPGNARSLAQATQVAYQVAKAATIYNVSEVVVLDVPPAQAGQSEAVLPSKAGTVKDGNKIKFNFDDDLKKPDETNAKKNRLSQKDGDSQSKDPSLLLAMLLQYFVTPPYLVGSVFKKDDARYLKHAKTCPTLTALPFMVANYCDANANAAVYREGLSIPEKTTSSKMKHVPGTKVKKSKKGKSARLAMTKYINVGLAEPLALAEGEQVPVNVRVTVNVQERRIVSPLEAYYGDTVGARVAVGYHVRIAKLFSGIFTEAAFPDGYSSAVFAHSGDYFNNPKLGNSEGGSNAETQGKKVPELTDMSLFSKNTNVLVMIGKKNDFKTSFKSDETLKEVDDINEFFNYELKIPVLTRIEDAVMISLTRLSCM